MSSHKVMIPTQSQHGFTLMELAIVMVVIGLIIGGVVAGQSMIKNAELNGVVSDITQIKTALDTFKNKYGELPGDMSDAFNYWDNGAGTICGTAAQCNGDGNGVFDRVSANENEKLRAWQHLQLAGVVEGSLIGYESTANDEAMGTNVKATAVDGAGLRFETVSSVNVIELGKDLGNPGIFQAGALYPEDAGAVDSKIDDGAANTGYIKAVNGTSQTGCVINPGVNDNYDLDSKNATCLVRFSLID